MSSAPSLKPMPSHRPGNAYDKDNERRQRASTARELKQKHDKRSDLRVGQGMSLILTSPGFVDYAIGFDDSGLLKVTNYGTGVDGTFVVDWEDVQGLAQELVDLETDYTTGDGAVSAAYAAADAVVAADASSANGNLSVSLTAAFEAADSTTEANANSYTDSEILIEQSVRATADATAATDRTLIRSEFASSDITLQANIDSEASTRVTAISAEATARETLAVQTLSGVQQNLMPHPSGLGDASAASTIGWAVSGGVGGTGLLNWKSSLYGSTYTEAWTSGFTSVSQRFYFYYVQDATPGDYTLSMFGAVVNMTAQLFMVFYNSGGTYLGESSRVSFDGTRQSVTATAPANTATVAVAVVVPVQTATGYADFTFHDVKLERGSTATAFRPNEASTEILRHAFIDTSTGQAIAQLDLTAAVGSDPARLTLKDGSGGSNIALEAKEVFFGSDTVFEDANDTFYTESGGERYRYGGPFGASSNLLLWFGPDSVALNSETAANGTFSLDTSGNINDPIAKSGQDSDAAFTMSTTSGTWETVCSATLDVAGACVLTFEGNLNWDEVVSGGSTQGTLQYRLRRDSTVIKGPVISDVLTATTAPETWDRNFPFDASYTDIPAAGNYTYTLQVQHVETATGTRSGKALEAQNMELAAVSFSR